MSGCVALLEGRPAEPWLLDALRGHAGVGPPYWWRVWAVRGLLWAWEPAATDALLAALADEAWRVREMAAKVVARHRVAAAFDAVVALQRDPTPRVRAAAARAVAVLTAAGA